LVGDLPRIELFARQKTDGWDVWGNEVWKSIKSQKQANILGEKREVLRFNN
jgi:site-specific DNA-methyltransferase (adenine-specific)